MVGGTGVGEWGVEGYTKELGKVKSKSRGEEEGQLYISTVRHKNPRTTETTQHQHSTKSIDK